MIFLSFVEPISPVQVCAPAFPNEPFYNKHFIDWLNWRSKERMILKSVKWAVSS